MLNLRQKTFCDNIIYYPGSAVEQMLRDKVKKATNLIVNLKIRVKIKSKNWK